MAHISFSRLVLDTANTLLISKDEVSADDIYKKLKIRSKNDRKRIVWILSDLTLAGRLTRLRQGNYGPGVQPKPDKHERMWRVLRMRHRIQVDDLIEMAGVSKDYAKQWLRLLVRRGIAVKQQEPGMKGTWCLIAEPAECPVDTDSAARLRKLRLQKKNRERSKEVKVA